MNFVPIPRNASTAVCQTLELEHQHVRASEVAGPRWAIVRNPYDRALSAYSFAATYGTEKVKTQYLCGARTFAEWLRGPDHLLSLPQSYWLDAPVDLLLRFEDLPMAFERHFGKRLEMANDVEPVAAYDDETRALVATRYAEDFDRFEYVA